jgi:hypothetical protein
MPGRQLAPPTSLLLDGCREKVEVDEANHPSAVRWIADLVNPEAADYHSVRLRLIAKSAAAACSASSGA